MALNTDCKCTLSSSLDQTFIMYISPWDGFLLKETPHAALLDCFLPTQTILLKYT